MIVIWQRANSILQEVFGRTRSWNVLTWPRLLVLAAVFCVVAFSIRPTSLLDVVSAGDDTSYISHAFAIALDFHLRYENEPVFGPGSGHLLAPSGHVPAHPIGPGLMAAPFVAFFSIFDHIADNPIVRDHRNYPGSWSLFGFMVAAASWFLLGAWLYINALEAIGAKTGRWMLLLLVSGIGLPYYVLLRPTMGHAFEFAAVALVFWGATRIATRGTINRAIPEVCMAIGLLLTMLVREADVNVLLLPIIVWGLLYLCGRGERPTLTAHFDGLILAIATSCACLIWISFNLALYGVAVPGIGDTYGYKQFFPIPRGGVLGSAREALRSLPLLWPLLTSSEFGLIYSSPILPAGGLAFMLILARNWKQKKLVTVVTFIACAIYVSVPLSIVLIFKTTGKSFGYRYLFDLLPICLLSTVLLLNDPTHTRTAKVARPTLVLLSIWALIGVMFVDTNPELTSRKAVNALGQDSSLSMVGYETGLVKVIMTPRGWVNMAVRRLPGFVAVRLTATNSDIIRINPSSLPPNTQNTINRIRKMRSSLFYAVILFCLTFPLCLAFLCDDMFRKCIFNFLEKIRRQKSRLA